MTLDNLDLFEGGPPRRKRATKATRRLLGLALVTVYLGVASVVAAQDQATAEAIAHLRSNVDAMLERDDLTRQRLAVLEEMRAGLDTLRPGDLSSQKARIVVGLSNALKIGTDDPTYQDVLLNPETLEMLVYNELNDDQAAELEAKLLLQPDDIVARTKLVIHYSGSPWEGSNRAHGEHVAWLIENAPYAHVLGTRGYISPRESELHAAGLKAWRRHVEREPDNPVFVARYARFMVWTDRRLYIELLERAHGLDPDNFLLAHELGRAYLLVARRSDRQGYDAEVAEKALTKFDLAYSLADHDIARTHFLQARAEAAFAAGRYDLAKEHARAVLIATKPEPNGGLMHEAYTVLGRVALTDGDTAGAKRHLLESATVPESSSLAIPGPTMSLAAELLALGERQVVLDYFDLCAVFWDSEDLNIWRAAINGGMTPDFGAQGFR